MTNEELKKTLWDAANKLRGSVSAAEYKYPVLGLVFLKYVSDMFDAQAAVIRRRLADTTVELPSGGSMMIAGLVMFVIHPGMQGEPLSLVAVKGAIFGLVAYATYDLTNQATLRDWPVTVTLADIAWGTVLTALASAGGFLAASRLGS